MTKDNSDPAFSVVIPLYNKEKEIERAIGSVISQTVEDFEIIVVDDGSTDHGPEKVRRIDDSRVKLIHQQNAGVSAARNCGISESRANMVAFLDADDEWLSDFLETLSNLKAKFPEGKVFATNYWVYEIGGGCRRPRIRGLVNFGQEGIITNYFEVASKSDPLFCSSSVAITKDAIGSIDLFPVCVSTGEDLITWARLAARYPVAYTKKPCAIFHRDHYHLNAMPARYPDWNDYIGQELVKIYHRTRSEGVKHYIGHWYQMRAAKYLELGKPHNAWSEIFRAFKFKGFNFHLIFFLLISILPGQMGKYLLCLARRRLR